MADYQRDRPRPRSAVKELEEASSTPRVALIESHARKHGNHTSFLPVVSSPSRLPQKKDKRAVQTERGDRKGNASGSGSATKHPVVLGKTTGPALPALSSNPNTPGNIRWLEDDEERNVQVLMKQKSQSKKLDEWPPDVTTSNFMEIILAVPKTNGKLKIQVRRLREPRISTPAAEGDGAPGSADFGLFVHAFRLPSRAEGVLHLGDEVIAAFGVSLVGESPSLFARLLSENPMGDFVELTVRRRDFGTLLSPGPEVEATMPASQPDPEPLPRSNNQLSPETIIYHRAEPEDVSGSAEESNVPLDIDRLASREREAEKADEKNDEKSMPLSISPAPIPAANRIRKPSEMFTSPLREDSANSDGSAEDNEPAELLQQSPKPKRHVSHIRKPSEMLMTTGLLEDSVNSANSANSAESSDRESPQKIVLIKEPSDELKSAKSAPRAVEESASKELKQLYKSDSSVGIRRVLSKEKVQDSSPVNTVRPKTADPAASSFKPRAQSDDIPSPPVRSRPEYFTPQVQNRKSVSIYGHSAKKRPQSRPHSSSTSSLYGRNTTAAGLTLLHNLSKQYTRAEARAESQCLSIALKQISHSGQTIVDLAARKIQCWAKLTIPRKIFLRRMDNRNFVRGILFQVSDKACTLGERRVKRRDKLLRMAAAISIQRIFRTWRRDYLFNVLRIQHAWRRAITRVKVRKLVTTVRACVLIYRYIQKKIKKYARLSRAKRMKLLCKIMKRYFDYQGFDMRRKQQAEFLLRYQHNSSAHMGNMLLQGRRRHIETSKRENAIIKIQRLLRGYKARLRCDEIRKSRRAMQAFRSSVMVFLIRLKARRRMKELAAVIKLQKRFRGMKERTKMYRRIVAGIKITQAWFKYRQYRKLKEYCRRIIRPLRITLTNIENIPSQTIYSGNLKIKVSVWWSPLLHLMGAKDYGTVVNSKRPQFVYKTQLRPVVLMSTKKNKEPEERKKTFPSFYNVASLRLAVEKSVSKLDSEVYIGQSFPAQKQLRPNVPFSVIKDPPVATSAPAPVASAADQSTGKTNWDEVSGNGDVFENLNQDIARQPVIPRRSSLRKSNESVPVMSPSAQSPAPSPVPTLESMAAAMGKMTPDSDDIPRPDFSRQSSGSSEVYGSPQVVRRKVSFDATNLERLEPFKDDAPADKTGQKSSPDVSPSMAPVPPEIVEQQLSQQSGEKEENKEAAKAPAEVVEEKKELKPLSPKKEEDFSHLNEGVDVLKKNPELLRRLSRRVSRARIAAEYREEDTAEGMAAAAAEAGDSFRGLKKLPSISKLSPAARGQHRKSSVLGKIGGDIASLFGAQQNKSAAEEERIRRQRFDSQMTMGCNFDNEVIHIPGCHGNSVIKFEVFDGDRKFGSSLFHLSGHNQLMFWGGEFEQEIELFKSRRLVNLDSNIVHDGSSRTSEEHMKPILKVKVEGGNALQSKCDWCRASFKGAGSGLSILASFFDKWSRYYVSLDGKSLRFLESKNSVDAISTIAVEDIKSYRVELSGFDRNAAKLSKTAFVEDGYFFIISTSSRDDVYIKFADSSIREDWEFTLEQILEKRGEREKEKEKPGPRKTMMSPKGKKA